MRAARDRAARRRARPSQLIVRLLALNVLALVAIVVSTNYWVFLAANACLGVTTASAQLLVPFAASLAGEKTRGRVVGTVMSGLLTGIVLTRSVSGGIAQASGWRAVFGVAALVTLLLTLLLSRVLPDERREGRVEYRALMASLVTLARANPTLVMRSLYGALVFACYNIVWTGLTFLLTRAPYGYSEGPIGLFGLIGIAGMLSARSAGRLFDRGHGNAAMGAFACMVLASFGLVAMGGHSLVALLAGMVLLDVGVYIADPALDFLTPEMYWYGWTASARSSSAWLPRFCRLVCPGSGHGVWGRSPNGDDRMRSSHNPLVSALAVLAHSGPTLGRNPAAQLSISVSI